MHAISFLHAFNSRVTTYIKVTSSLAPSFPPSQWFTDYLSDLCEDDHLQRYLDIRIFLTNIDSPPDELASALLQLGLKTAGESCNVRRPSQPQLNNLYHMTSYGVPDFDSLIDCKCVCYTCHMTSLHCTRTESCSLRQVNLYTLGICTGWCYMYSLIPRLSQRANEKLQATESWAGPGNKATICIGESIQAVCGF